MNRQETKDPLLPLLQQATGGDRESFRTLYEESCQRITVYLHRMVQDQNSIDDILVETYTRVWQKGSTFQGRSLVLTWMIGIARNLALKEISRRKYHKDIADHPELTAAPIDKDGAERKKVLDRALALLSPKHREILDLGFYQDLPYREIAHLLHIPVSTVKSRIFYAKSALKTALDKMGIDKDDL